MAGTESLGAASIAPAPPLAAGEVVDGIYRVERRLGEGGGGTVYLVHNLHLDGARFALKVLRERPGRSTELLLREGKNAAEVRSAHVVKVAAIGRLPAGGSYLVMEYVEGSTLEELLSDRDLTTPMAIDCARQLCLALEAAHGQSLLHGDVSLRNVFVTLKPDGSPHLQLGDFGLARRIHDGPAGTISLELGSPRGTPRFMAPEAISSDEVDERADLFAVGVVVYRLLAGRFPFDGETTREILAAVLRCTPAPLSAVRPGMAAFDEALDACLVADPKARIASARALREALERARDAPPASRSPRPRKHRARAAAGAALALSVSGAGLLGVDEWRDRASVELGAAIACPDTVTALPDVDADVLHAVARGTCARVGAGLDLDWSGGPGATPIHTSLARDGDGVRLDVAVDGRRVSAHGASPRAAMLRASALLLARVEEAPMTADELRRWGASDHAAAAAVRALWRRRTSMVLGDYEQEPRKALALDPKLPLAHLLLADVDHDPARRREARSQALAHADRLPPARAAALRAWIAATDAAQPDDAALEALRRAWNEAPGDIDVGVLYASALANAGRGDSTRSVAEQLHERFPLQVPLALHHAAGVPERAADESARWVAWQIAALPELRAATSNIMLLTGTGRLAEADAALAFARRFGVDDNALAIPAAVVAMALGDPERIDRATAAHPGSTATWSHKTGARLRFAGLVSRGQIAAAQSYIHTLIAGRRAAGDVTSALAHVAEALRLARLTGGLAVEPEALAWAESASADAALPLGRWAMLRTELALARGGDLAGALATVDAELERRAAGDALALMAAHLATLPLARAARGDAEAARRWRAGGSTWLEPRTRFAFDGALALEAAGASSEEIEAAYRLATSAHSIDRHPFEAIAGRVRLVARGADGDGALAPHVERAWADADHGLRERVLSLR